MTNLMDNTTFWKDLDDFKAIVDKFEVEDEEGRLFDFLNDSKNLTAITSIALPSGNFTVDFCYLISMPRNIRFSSIHVNYLKDIYLYVHYPQQFLSTWIKNKNILPSSTNINILKTTTSVTINKLELNLNLGKRLGIPKKEYIDQDKCIKDLHVNEKNTIQYYVEGNKLITSTERQKQFQSLKENITTTLAEAHIVCDPTHKHVEVELRPTVQADNVLTDVITSADNYKVQIISSDLNLEELPKKPSLVIKFPKITKITKVIFWKLLRCLI